MGFAMMPVVPDTLSLVVRDHSWCHIDREGTTLGAEEWLRDYLSIKNKGSWFSGGPARLPLVDWLHRRFPVGLLHQVSVNAEPEGVDIRIVDNRSPAPEASGPRADWLRGYQEVLVERALQEKRGILQAPTGSGKTEVVAALVQAVPVRWLFVVHRTNLALQGAERIEKRTGERPGVFCTGRKEHDRRVVCASFQTLRAASKHKDFKAWAASFGGIVVDECHVLPAQTFARSALACVNAAYRIGVSATPLARDDMKSAVAVGVLGPVVYQLRPQDLPEGTLARPRIRMVKCPQVGAFDSWHEAYETMVVASPDRNKLVSDMVSRAAKPCVVFVQRLEHARLLQHRIAKLGLSCDIVDGGVEGATREQAARALDSCELDVAVATVVWQEGVDMPNLRSVVVAGGGKSVIATVQRMGRGSRRAEGKSEFEVWDVADTGVKWLQAHARERLKAYRNEGYEVEVIEK